MCCSRPIRGPSAHQQRLARRQGFTLVEIMVVLVLIGLLAGVVTINVRGYMTRGRQEAARAELATICQAIETFYTLAGRYPTSEEGLALLTQPGEQLAEPLLTQMPLDPWGREYQYVQPGRSGPYELVCLGADGREGGSGADADITSSNLKAVATQAP